MKVVLRIVGIVWILLSLKAIINNGVKIPLNVIEILSLTMLAGGIGLTLLKEWGRWILLIGSIAFLIMMIGPSLIQGKIGPVALRNFVFYGIFIALLIMPQSKAATH
jgi:hypothetical protein